MRRILETIAKIARLDVLGYLVKEGYISPSLARGVEILILGSVAFGLSAMFEFLSNGGTGFNGTLTVGVTAALAFFTKALRAKATQASVDFAKKAQDAAEELAK